jgi:hypothetical protein
MKTDVIFLGAGASRSAGFPLNADLARYIMYDFAGKSRDMVPLRYREPDRDFLSEWKSIASSLREAQCLSIDEYCRTGQNLLGTAIEMKQLLRLALYDHRTKWWQWNEYVPFIYSLFEPSSHELIAGFTVVNFNYDGLFSKLLTDAVIKRRELKRLPPLSYHQLAPAPGGWYGHGLSDRASEVAGVEKYDIHAFSHLMPHGTITSHINELGRMESLQENVYSSDVSEAAERIFLQFYHCKPLIRFPWEGDGQLSGFTQLYDHGRESVESADRIHIIGMSGHRLLRESMSKMFRTLRRDHLARKTWHIATADPDPKGVLEKLLDCILSEEQRKDPEVRSVVHARTVFYSSFADWIRAEPHLRHR